MWRWQWGLRSPIGAYLSYNFICSPVNTEKAKDFHRRCSQGDLPKVQNLGLPEDSPWHLPVLRMSAHFRLAPGSWVLCSSHTSYFQEDFYYGYQAITEHWMSVGQMGSHLKVIWRWFWICHMMDFDAEPRGWAIDSSLSILNGTQMWEGRKRRREHSRDPEEQTATYWCSLRASSAFLKFPS